MKAFRLFLLLFQATGAESALLCNFDCISFGEIVPKEVCCKADFACFLSYHDFIKSLLLATQLLVQGIDYSLLLIHAKILDLILEIESLPLFYYCVSLCLVLNTSRRTFGASFLQFFLG